MARHTVEVNRVLAIAIGCAVLAGACSSSDGSRAADRGTSEALGATSSTSTPRAASDSGADATTNSGPPSTFDATVSPGPGGGGAYSTAGASADGSVILAGSDLSGLSRSDDGGRSWTVVGSAHGLTDTHISAIGFDRSSAGEVFVGGESGLWWSGDRGQTFERRGVDGYISAIDADGERVFVGAQSSFDLADGRVEISLDRGHTWATTGGLPPGSYVLALRVAPGTDRVLALVGPGRFVDAPAEVHLSTDAGASWDRLDVAEPVLDARFDADDPSTVWLATDGGDDDPGTVVRWSDGVFETVAGVGGLLLPEPTSSSLRVIDPRFQYPWDDRNGAFEVADGTVRRVSTIDDWGHGWSEVYYAYGESFNGTAPTFGFDPSDPDRVFWVNHQFIYESRDGGETFDQVFADEVSPGRWRSRGFDNIVLEDLAVSADGEAVYAGFWDLGCFRSLDRGASWENCNTVERSGDWEGFGGFTGTIVTDPDRAEVVWLTQAQDWESPATLVRSTDRGEPGSWTAATGLPEAADLLGLAVDPSSAPDLRVMYVTSLGDVYRSDDDGLTWHLDFACGGCRVTAVDSAGVTFAGGEAGLFVRDAAGWDQLELPGSPGPISAPQWWEGWTGVEAIEPLDDGRVALAVRGVGVVIGTPEGDFVAAFDNPYVRDVVTTTDGTLWAGSSSAYPAGGWEPDSLGLVRSLDGGQTWATVDIGLAWPFVSDLAGSAEGLYLASPGEGIRFVSD